ncbi:MAG TPA: hypothetical protein VJZ25_08485, partial [Gemmatimonadaceae bacterium]|nr:hypothetical protein [Gemmatimonadaceae bacterium]
MKLAHRLLLYGLGIVGVLVVAAVLIIERQLRERLTEHAADALAREARLVVTQWDAVSDPDGVADAAATALGHRVTLINGGGVVVGDSEFDGHDLRALGNEADLPEVAAARNGFVGTARRGGDTRRGEEFNVAVKGPQGIVRISLPTASLEQMFDRTRNDILFAGAIALLLLVIVAGLFSQSVSRSLVELRDFAREMADGDLSRRPALSAPGEVG